MSANDSFASNYAITSQSHGTRLNAGGNVTEGWTVGFRDGLTGVTGSVFVEDDYYTPENVRELIANQLQTIRVIHTLGQ